MFLRKMKLTLQWQCQFMEAFSAAQDNTLFSMLFLPGMLRESRPPTQYLHPTLLEAI